MAHLFYIIKSEGASVHGQKNAWSMRQGCMTHADYSTYCPRGLFICKSRLLKGSVH